MAPEIKASGRSGGSSTLGGAASGCRRPTGGPAAGPGRRNAARSRPTVVGPDGRITYRAIPFREIDPTAYQALGAAVRDGK